jgi:hypothetical protein
MCQVCCISDENCHIDVVRPLMIPLLSFCLCFCAVLRIRDVLSRIQIQPLLHPGSRSQIRGVKKHRIPDPTYFCIKAINKFCQIRDKASRIRIPDPGGKTHRIQDPDSQHCLCATVLSSKRFDVG